jgi:glycosyltransferase involved in cell wall biosynthesis
MKIAHVCTFYTPAIGGVKQVVEELAKRQAKAGHEVHVFTSDWDKEKIIKKEYELIDGVHIHRCKHYFRAANFSVFWPSLLPKLLKQDLDIIHSHLFAHPHFIFSTIAAEIKKIPHIHTTHCPWSDAKRSIIGKLGILVSYNIFSRIALRFTKKVIAITPWENNFIEKYGANPNKIVNLPNGMSKEFFKKIKNNDFKKKHNIKGKMVLFFGRLNETKQPDKFVDIAKLILNNRDDIEFVIVGPDEGLQDLVLKKINGEKKIHFLGAIRDRVEVLKMYQSADVYVLPSYREGLPLTLFEAMASGLPIVASPVNGIPFEIKNKENGFLVDRNNINGFKNKILEILDNEKLREKISKNNIKKSINYTWDIISKKTLEIYNSK